MMHGKQLAGMIDHTQLRPEAGEEQLRQVVEEARRFGFAAVCVSPVYIGWVREQLQGSGVKACTVAGFPLGASTAAMKAMEAAEAVERGAQEVDFVAHLPALLACDKDAAAGEFARVVQAVRAVDENVTIKVIIESALLMAECDERKTRLAERRINLACRAAYEAGCDFVKTSTGFHPAGGASAAAVRLMRKHSFGLQVKASGGIRTYDDARRMIDAGAHRLGCSASAAIMEAAAKV